MPARSVDRAAPDGLSLALGGCGLIASVTALLAHPARTVAAARATGPPFLALGLVLVIGGLAARAGVFDRSWQLVDRAVGDRRRVAIVAVLGWVGLLSAVVNLDVAVVVGMPIALAAGRRTGIPAARIAIGVAATANAASFLLPTSNVTTLLVVGDIEGRGFLQGSWVAWGLTTTLTVLALAWFAANGATEPRDLRPDGRIRPIPWRVGALTLDLVAMFAIAVGVRAWLGDGIGVDGGFLPAFFIAGPISAIANNLPVAAALTPHGSGATWGTVLGLAIGPNLLVWGSVATVICRRIVIEEGGTLPWRTFSLAGAVLFPLQAAVAFVGLRLTGAI